MVRALFSWRYALNYLVILMITCWIPMLRQTATMTDAEGAILQQQTVTSRLYESWWIVIRNAPGAQAHRRAVAMHLGLCFAVSFAVWALALYRTGPPKPEQSAQENDSGQSTPDTERDSHE